LICLGEGAFGGVDRDEDRLVKPVNGEEDEDDDGEDDDDDDDDDGEDDKIVDGDFFCIMDGGRLLDMGDDVFGDDDITGLLCFNVFGDDDCLFDLIVSD